MCQHEPGVAGPLADAAVDDGFVVRLDEPVELLQLVSTAEPPAVVGGFPPGDRARRWDVAGAQRAFLGIVRHVGALAGVLVRRAHVDQRLGTQDGQHVVFERADRRVVALHDGIARGGSARNIQRAVAPVVHPQVASAVEQPHIRVAEEREDPQRVRRPPVALVAVDDHGVVARNPFAVHQFRELLTVDVVAHPWVVEVGVPVDFDRPGDVADVVEQHVLIGFDDGKSGPAQVAGQPVGGDQPFRVGVGAQRRAGICW